MRALRFFFPIAFRLSNSKGKLVMGIIIHALILVAYFLISTAALIILLPLWVALFFIPKIRFVFIILFVAQLFLLFVVGMVMPFYCAGGIILGVLNYKKILSVLDDRPSAE